MKRQKIDTWEGITDYRPPIFEEYEFDFSLLGDMDFSRLVNPNHESNIGMASLNYANEIVGNPANELWVERRKLTDAFKMGIEYAKRYKL